VTRSDDRFGELRSLLQRAPDPQTWGELCALLDEWPEDASLTEIALPYCEAHMRGWQDAWRVAPKRWITRLVEGEPIPALTLARRIRAHNTLYGHARAQPLIRHPALATLTHLDLSLSGIGEEDAHALFAALSPSCALTSLDLSRNDCETLRALGDWLALPALPPLKRLCLVELVDVYSTNKAHMMTHALQQLAASPARIKHLDLSDNLHLHSGERNQIDPLLHAIPSLDSLGLDGPFENEELMQDMAHPIWARRVRHLSLGGHAYSDLELCALREASATLGALQTLKLSKSGLTDDLLSTLCAPLVGGHAWQLTALELAHNKLTDASVELLLDQPWFPQLQHLDLSSNLISDTGALALISSPRLHPRAHIQLHDNDLDALTQAAIAALRPELAHMGERWRAAAMDPNDPWWIA
jgi:hypothetical protein